MLAVYLICCLIESYSPPFGLFSISSRDVLATPNLRDEGRKKCRSYLAISERTWTVHGFKTEGIVETLNNCPFAVLTVVRKCKKIALAQFSAHHLQADFHSSQVFNHLQHLSKEFCLRNVFAPRGAGGQSVSPMTIGFSYTLLYRIIVRLSSPIGAFLQFRQTFLTDAISSSQPCDFQHRDNPTSRNDCQLRELSVIRRKCQSIFAAFILRSDCLDSFELVDFWNSFHHCFFLCCVIVSYMCIVTSILWFVKVNQLQF